MDDAHRLASYDTSLVVSGGVDCGRRQEMCMTRSLNAVDNRTVHLTACSDKSVAYVTNNKRLHFVLLNLTDRYEASRSLFVTAELVVGTVTPE